MVANQETGNKQKGTAAAMRRLQRVRFSEVASSVVCTMQPRSGMSDDEKNLVWFSPAEMDSFKNNVRILSAFLAMDTSGTVHDDEVKVLRTLNQCRADQRQIRKNLAIKTVLQCQRVLRELEVMSPLSSAEADQRKAHSRARRIGEVSSQCSGWARDLSRVRGLTDYFEAYPDAMAALCSGEKRSSRSSDENVRSSTEHVCCLEDKQRSLKRRRLEDHSGCSQLNRQGQ